MSKTAAAVRHDAPIEGPPPPILMMPIKELYLATEAPKGINLTVRDSSSGSPLTDSELKASIYAKGIIQPLIFKSYDGKLYVIAGNRRLRFLREIFADALDSQVQTQDVDQFDGDWREIAMDTNLSLPPHLVERYELIVTLTKDLKLSPADARMRFGMTERQFNQVMALGKMSKKVREAWRSGEIDAKTAQAFTLEPDAKEQDRIFDLCKKQGHNGRVESHDVRRRIIPENQRDSGRFAAFVGIDVCKKAKIIKQEDLFSTSHVVTDLRALKKLVSSKLAERCEQLVADGGWSWATAEDDVDGNVNTYGRLEPANKSAATPDEQKRLADLNTSIISLMENGENHWDFVEELEKLEENIKSRGFTAAQKSKSGCFLKISYDGSLSIEYGRVKPEVRKSVEAADRRAQAPSSPAKDKAKKNSDVVLTNALAQRLSEQLQAAGAEALKMEHTIATSAVIAAISSGGHVLNINVGGQGSRKAASFSSIFIAALKSTPQQREAMFGQIAAQALSIVTFNAMSKPPLEDEGIADLFEAMSGPRVTKEIFAAFDPKNYFVSVSLEACVEAVRCACGDGAAAEVAKMKKPAAAKFAIDHCTKAGWLPKQLRTAWYTGPTEGEKAKATPKATPAKKAAKKKAKK